MGHPKILGRDKRNDADSIWHYNCYVSLVTSRVITLER
jgi:hypothetical protein